MEWWQIILVFYLCFISVIGVTFFVGNDSWWFNSTPKEIYNKINLNWFGCYFLWFLEFLCMPHIWIFCWIAKFVLWLFTVGRKD